MKMSENVGELFTALSKAQGEFDAVGKSKEGYGYKYAELGACIEAVKPVLAANGLAVTQHLGYDDSGNTTLTTILSHSSGQYMQSTSLMPHAVLSGGAGKNPVQCMGASITYVRRYAFTSILGLAQVDTDAADMVAAPKQTKAKKQTQDDDNKPWFNDEDYVSQIDAIKEAVRTNQHTPQSAINLLRETYKVSRDMAESIMNAACEE